MRVWAGGSAAWLASVESSCPAACPPSLRRRRKHKLGPGEESDAAAEDDEDSGNEAQKNKRAQAPWEVRRAGRKLQGMQCSSQANNTLCRCLGAAAAAALGCRRQAWTWTAGWRRASSRCWRARCRSVVRPVAAAACRMPARGRAHRAFPALPCLQGTPPSARRCECAGAAPEAMSKHQVWCSGVAVAVAGGVRFNVANRKRPPR